MELQKYSITFSSPTDCSLASGLLLLFVLNVCDSVWSFSDEVLFSSFYSIFFFILFISLRRICVFFSLAHLPTLIHLHPTCCVIVSIVWFRFDSLALRMPFYTNPSHNRWCRLCNSKENFPSNFLCSTVVHIIKNDAATNVESTEEILCCASIIPNSYFRNNAYYRIRQMSSRGCLSYEI